MPRIMQRMMKIIKKESNALSRTLHPLSASFDEVVVEVYLAVVDV